MPVVGFLSIAARFLGSPAGMMLGVSLAALSIYQYGKHTGYANCRTEWVAANAAADLEKKKLEAKIAKTVEDLPSGMRPASSSSGRSSTGGSRTMKLSWQNVLTVSACLTTLILSGCATNPGGRPELATHIPDACEKLAVRVAHPRYKKGTDVRIVLAKYAAVGGALDQANARLDAVRECSRVQRELFGAG